MIDCQKCKCLIQLEKSQSSFRVQPFQPSATTACQQAKAAESRPRKSTLSAFSPFSREFTGASADLWMSRRIREQEHRSADYAIRDSATFLPGKFSGYES